MFRDSNKPQTNNWAYVAAGSGAATLYILGKAVVNSAFEIPQNIANHQIDQAVGNGGAIVAGAALLIVLSYLEKMAIIGAYKKLSYDVKHLLKI